MEQSMKFLKALARNNNREWFEKNKGKYLAAKEEFEAFVADLLEDLILLDASLEGLNPKKLTFRIYRDVRFSKDKRPYKTNFGASFSGTGKGMGVPGYYLQVEPGNKSFVAAGLYMPDAEKLAKVRQEIDFNGEHLNRVLKQQAFKKLFGGLWDGDQLKTAPKGYAKDHPLIHHIRLKSFIATHDFPDAVVLGKKFRSGVVSACKAVKPLNDFLREALD